MTQIVADFREMFAEQVHYRELLFQMVKRDLLLRYKQTVMGFGWAIFMPLLNTLISMQFSQARNRSSLVTKTWVGSGVLKAQPLGV